jgi:hypothetical protein
MSQLSTSRLFTQLSGLAFALVMTVATLGSLQALAVRDTADTESAQQVVVVGHRSHAG